MNPVGGLCIVPAASCVGAESAIWPHPDNGARISVVPSLANEVPAIPKHFS